MKKTLLSFTCLITAACSGYTPLYTPQTGSSVVVGTIQMETAARNVGERRAAQRIHQKLRQSFPRASAPYRVDVSVKEDSKTLAVRKDATVARAQMTLTGYVQLRDVSNNTVIYSTEVFANASYNMEDTPYSTESGKTFARMQAADVLAREITRMIQLEVRSRENNATEVPVQPLEKEKDSVE